MEYTLMHKNIYVADIDIDEATGSIAKIGNTESSEHLPVGIHYNNGVVNRIELNGWWSERSIPASRSGIKDVLDTLNIQNPKMLLTHCFGLSLSDQYWIKPKNSDLKWEEINFFENSFSDDIGNMMFGDFKKNVELNLCSPDNTSDGCLKKRWKIIDGKRCLLKAGELPYYQQPFNEVIASIIMDRLDIPHTQYSIIWQNDQPYSMCEDFITPETELISAWRVCQIRNKANHENDYLHYVNLCKEFGVTDIEHSLDMMIVLDYIIANEDRHFNNFGIIRNADTLKWVGAAPIFDSGTSLAYNRPPHQLFKISTCKPFKSTHGEELKLVNSFDWIDFSKLYGIEESISEMMSSEQAKSVLGETRHEDISGFVKQRVTQLEKVALQSIKSNTNKKTVKSIEK